MGTPKLSRFIKDRNENKVPSKTTSINVELRHWEFLKRRNLNLSGIVRDLLTRLMLDNPDTDDTD